MAGSPAQSSGVWTIRPDGSGTSPAPVERQDTAGIIDSGTPEPISTVAECKRFGDRYRRDIWTGTDQIVLGPGGPAVIRESWGGGKDSRTTGESVFPDNRGTTVAGTDSDDAINPK